jgi:glycosyltransferase involved in cell wall biosynthesis
VRIAIEVFGTQSPSRHRGVGRYTHEFVNALLELETGHEFVLYAQDGAPTDYLPGRGRADVRAIAPDTDRGERNLSDAMRRILGTNEDRIDTLLLCNPSELRFDYSPPAPPLNGVKVVVVVYDLIPLLFPEHYIDRWPGPEYARLYFRSLERIKRYDALLAISDATRDDFIDQLSIPPERITNIRTGTDSRFFCPDPLPSVPEDLESLGVTGPFVFSMGAMEFRKNLWGLIDAFAGLPEPIRSKHQLVLTYLPNHDEVWAIRHRANQRGILDQVVITGRIDDRTLRTLYRRCAAFVFPSLYEGFGLPVLEAMLCGAPVIAGSNSSQIEIVGDAGLLADVVITSDMTDKLEKILGDPEFAADLRRRAPVQGSQFTWKDSAERAVEALESLQSTPPLRAHRSHSPKPRIAFFSPFPPLLSGVADYAGRLVTALKDHYRIDIYHDSGYTPKFDLHDLGVGCHHHKLFHRNAAILGYHAFVYQMGNSQFHKYLYDLLPRYPGLVTMHDFNLSNFHYWNANVNGRGLESFREEMAAYDPEVASKYGPMLHRWSKLPGGVVAACVREGIYLNHKIFEHATGLVFHSPWGAEKSRALYPGYPGGLTVLPFGATAMPVDQERRGTIRSRYGLPHDALIVGNFGLIHQTKMNVESVRAFAPLAERDPNALFVLVGPEWDNGEARACAESLGIQKRVRFLGPRLANDFVDLVSCVDIGLNLRRPPTNGETSSSLLDLIRQGIPAIVTDVGTFSDFPERAVRKVKWDGASSQDLLTRTFLDLASSREAREALSASALAYVRERHDWSLVAAAYAEAIEASLSVRAEPSHATSPGPHFKIGARAVARGADR